MTLAPALGRATWVSVSMLMFVACAPALRVQPAARVSGIRFSVDSADSPSPARGVLGAMTGIVVFGSGRGRFDLASNYGRAVSVDGIVMTRPLASAGDYYLFDSTGFILVRPHGKTFSVFPIARSWIHRGSARDANEGFMEFVGIRADTLRPADPARLRLHGPFTVRWHVDRRRSGSPPIDVLSRGWTDVTDAPAGEATVARWFGAAAALDDLSTGTDSLHGADLQLTAAIVLNAPERRGPLNLIVLHPIHGFARADIDVSRLVLPAGFKETAWPGFEREMKVPPTDDARAKWRRLPGATRK